MTRKFPVPGIEQSAIGLKHVEEAVAIRDRILVSFDRAANLPPGPERTRLLTVVFVGGGFTGVEGFGETLSLATALLDSYSELSRAICTSTWSRRATGSCPRSRRVRAPGWCVRSRSAVPGCISNTSVRSAEDGHVVLSDGEEFDAELIVWTAGNAANPVVAKHTDLPVTDARPDRRPRRPAGRHP